VAGIAFAFVAPDAVTATTSLFTFDDGVRLLRGGGHGGLSVGVAGSAAAR
jgi:hypothetical protein